VRVGGLLRCAAVGDLEDSARWNGQRWKFGGSPGGLDAVWCLRSNRCVAAGARDVNLQTTFLSVARWNGARWFLEPAPSAAQTILNGVTCTGPSACVAVGSAGSQPLVLRYR